MTNDLIKINLKNVDCKNIYFDNRNGIFGTKEITKAPTYIGCDFKLYLRVYAVDESGNKKQTKKSFSFSNKITFLQAIKEVASQRENLIKQLKEGNRKTEKTRIPTLKEAWDEYIEMKRNQLSPNTINGYILVANKWIFSDEKLSKTPITQISTRRLQYIVNKMLDMGMAPRSSKSIKEALRPLFKYYVANGTLKSNPAIFIQIPKFNNEVSIELSDDKLKELYDLLYNYPVEPFRSIFVWLSHGRRLNEVLSLEWRDINLEAMTYTIRYENNKVRKPMTYKLSNELLEALQNIGIKESGFVFPAMKDKSQKMDNSTLRKHWQKVLDKLGLHIRIHDLRHLIGGVLVSEGKTLEQIASILGHTSTSVTKRYSKVRQEVAAEGLDEFFKRVKK